MVLLMAWLWLVLVPSELFAQLDVQSLYADLDDEMVSSLYVQSTAKLYRHDLGSEVHWGRSERDLDSRLVMNNKVSDNLRMRADVGLQLGTEDPQKLMFAYRYGVHAIFLQYGVLSLGRMYTPTRQSYAMTTMSSGITATPFRDAPQAEMVLRDSTVRVGVLKDWFGYGLSRGTDQRAMLVYTLPWSAAKLSLGVSAMGKKAVYEGALRFDADWLAARWSWLLAYANAMPSLPNYTDSHYASLASKFSIADLDVSSSYSTLLSPRLANVVQWTMGADYQFVNFSAYGPLSMGLGAVYRKNGLLSYPNVDDLQVPVHAAKAWVVSLGLHQRLGQAGLKLRLDRFVLSAREDVSRNLLRLRPLHNVVLSLYYNLNYFPA